MSKKEKIQKKKWYDDGDTVTSAIIGIIIAVIICSQSLANGELSFALFSSVINHNSIYLLVLIYFILIKFSVGKKYFNYFNIFLIFIYFIATLTSLLTVIQSFSLTPALTFIMNFIVLLYLTHTLFRDTVIWTDFHLSKSPFNELTNEWFFYAMFVISIILLAVNLISTVVVSGVVVAVLDTIYYILFGRYIFLYREFLDRKKIHVDNEGNFDEVRGKVQEVLDKTDIDDKIVEGYKDVKEKVTSFVEENKLDEKAKNVKNKIVETSNDVGNRVKDAISTKKVEKKKTTKKGDQ
jgi:hypothetical protein